MKSTQSMVQDVEQLAQSVKGQLSRLQALQQHGHAGIRQSAAKELSAFARDLEAQKVPESARSWLMAEYFKFILYGPNDHSPPSR